MKTISHESLVERQKWIERRLRFARKWSYDPDESDFQLLRRQQRGLVALFVFNTFFLINVGIEKVFEAEELIDWGLLSGLLSVGLEFYLAYIFTKFSWALEAFDQFAPQEIDQLKEKITERNTAPMAPPEKPPE